MYRSQRAFSYQHLFILTLFAGMCLTGPSAHTSNPPPTAPQCSFCIYPTARSYSSDLAIGSVSVTAPAGCDWTATSNDSFITVTSGTTGAGQGVVTYSVASNSGNVARTGTIAIAGQTFTVTQERVCAPRPANLAGWWPAEDNANDLLGVNNGALQGGVAFLPGKVGSAFNFDGVEDTFQTPPTAILNTLPLTIEAWVKPALRSDGTDFPNNVVSNDRPGFSGHGFGVNVFPSGSQMKVEYQQGARIVPGVSFAAGQWYHVAVVYTTGNLKVYVDGQQVDDFSYSQGALDGDNVIRIGFHNNNTSLGSGRFFKGLIDEVSVYNRALSAPEIQNIYNADTAGKCREIDFVDVLTTHPFYTHIRRLSALAITLGCSGTSYCPDDVVTRQQMAAFIIRALGIFNPPQPAAQRFADVPPSNPFYAFIEQMALRGITLGCGGGNYCPNDVVTRQQMAAFIIRALGAPNPPVPAQQRFDDVPPSNPFYNFIEEMAIRRITLGCSANLYCPGDSVTRGQMAAFLVRAFDTEINFPPVVFAGTNQAVTLPSSANLAGLASDDGLPGCGTLTVTWSQVSGPGTVTFSNPNATATSASFSAAGTYVLRLTGNDSQLSSVSDITITVNPVNPNNQPPAVNAGPDQTIDLPNGATLNGAATDDGAPSGTLAISWTLVSGPATAIFGNASNTTTTVTFSAPGSYVLRLSASDSQLAATDEVAITVNADPTPPPPDPEMIAPPLDPTVTTTIATATEFLYTGANPIQTGVAPGTINAVRAVVLRGKVMSRGGSPIPRAKIKILNHPEFGQTFSRADGQFDMAVNGGAPLVVSYEKAGFLPVQRRLSVPAQDYSIVDNVVMIGYDPNVKRIDLGANIPVQLALGSAVTDSSGSRRAALMFKQGTTATMVLPGGATQPLTILHVRATEYTVGPNGPETMPGELPPASLYTYAIDYSVDEAVAVGAKEVMFSQPVISYEQNFLNFPVGTTIPSGFYDASKSVWTPSDNGRVVKILAITGGQADLDLTGSGVPASNAEYSALGINAAERQQLATLFHIGETLWRVPIKHFSPWDKNWGFGPPPDAKPPTWHFPPPPDT